MVVGIIYSNNGKGSIREEITMHILELNRKIRKGCKDQEYHMQHIGLAKDYAMFIRKKLGESTDRHKLGFAALSHDLLKENYDKKDLFIDGMHIPGDLEKYVSSNIELLSTYHITPAMIKTDLQAHALGAAIFLIREYHINDPEIIYPVLFHSLPIIEIYRELPEKIQQMIDIMVLADKLSSNWLRINMNEEKVRCDLDQIVFGKDGKEFNFSLGLYLARVIGAGKNPDYTSDASTLYYFHRLRATNPLIQEKLSMKKSLGEKQKWPKRNSVVSRN